MPTNLFYSFMLAAQTAEAEVMPPGSILRFDKELLIKLGVQGFNILLLTALLVLLLYKPVKKFMNNRSERIKHDIETARLGKEDAQELKVKYEQMIEDIGKEREQILKQEYTAAKEAGNRLLLSARQEAKHLVEMAEDRIKVERENASEDIKRQIIELATVMATHFVEVSIDQKTQDKYIEETLADWGE